MGKADKECSRLHEVATKNMLPGYGGKAVYLCNTLVLSPSHFQIYTCIVVVWSARVVIGI